MSNLVKNDKKVINAWCMYDWANSVYALTITTAIFPAFFLSVTGGDHAAMSFFGFEVENAVAFSYALTIANIMVAVLNPFLSSLADIGGNKKRFMQVFCYLGAAGCSSLFFMNADSATWTLGIISFILAGIGFAGSQVFYNAFLPEIATEDRFDKISARGFAMGYIGSVLLLIVNLIMILMPELFGQSTPEAKKAWGLKAPQISFLMVGVWWMGFAQITFKRLPNNVYDKRQSENFLKKAIKELKVVVGQLKHLTNARKFLLSFMFYSMGVQTVMFVATVFGKEVVKLDMTESIILVLILQLLAIVGAYVFSKISEKKGNIFSLAITLCIWMSVCVAAYFIGAGMKVQFYIIGVFVGFIMGGVQSMSRSTYAKFIPQETTDHASFFSFFDTIEKSSIALGTFVYGLVLQVTGSQNNSALALLVFFVIGFIFLLRIPSKQVYNTTLKK